MKASEIFTEKVKANIIKAIENAELETSGEIKLHVDNTCEKDVLDRAAYLFKKLKMHNTDLKNGVLFYVAIEDRKIAILGDIGISNKVENDFWDEVRDIVLKRFKASQFSEGLTEGIAKAGEKLKIHFPYSESDVNELDNEISFEE
jgi:uncharacterized membrane protein